MGQTGDETLGMDMQTLRQLEAEGITVKGAQKVRAQGDVVEIEVEPENWDAVRVFVGMDTQWRFASLTVGRASALLRTGLDYSALAPVAAGLGVAVDGPLLEALRVLEQETVRLGDRRFKASLRAS